MSDLPVYSIGAVARMLRTPAATLRTWEERYGIVVPERGTGGHRLYSRNQVERLRFVRDKISEGLSPADAHRVLKQYLGADRELPLVAVPRDVDLMILLAERDEHAADFAEYFLRTEGFAVCIVTSAEEAIGLATANPPDLAVVDLQISGGTGLRVCLHLRECLDVPVVAISTLALREEALQSGATAFLQKPLDPLRLVAVVKDLLGRSAYLRSEEKPNE